MAEHMQPISFEQLLNWILEEYSHCRSVFGVPETQFFHHAWNSAAELFDDKLDLPVGPAAGPHTQLAQNILSGYLCGGRFFELKTVQVLDRLTVEKPCIDALDEGYNVEWSQELTLEQSAQEYIHAWILLHLVKELFGLSNSADRGFIFNMSVGYDLNGVQSPVMDQFISAMQHAGNTPAFQSAITIFRKYIESGTLHKKIFETSGGNEPASKIMDRLRKLPEQISPDMVSSVTLSTMHGCPPDEIERIARYLLTEKGLHTYVKLNPTLLQYRTVTQYLKSFGFEYIIPDEAGFKNDLQMTDAVPMLKRLQELARRHNRQFGVKLSNTLGVANNLRRLPGKDMYLSGRALYPMTILLAAALAGQMDGDLAISFSGGATVHNIPSILDCGVYPVTLVTDLLKPGGYMRLGQIAGQVSNHISKAGFAYTGIQVKRLQDLAENALRINSYHKNYRPVASIKIDKKLPAFDCYVAPCREACPIHQDVAEYIRLCEESRYEEATQVIIDRNPLPHITGYICDHQCMNHCVRWDFDQPVEIRELKKIAVESGFDGRQERTVQLKPDYPQITDFGNPESNSGVSRNSSSGKQVQTKAAVIGAGPSGLAMAYFLSQSGFDISVFDSAEKAGGTVQHLIPDFRLPQQAIDRDMQLIAAKGVQFQFGTDRNFNLAELKQQGFPYIYLATGAGRSKKLNLEKGSERVIDVIDFLRDFHTDKQIQPGKKVAVIGGGNSAMDGARAALRCAGVENVGIVYRRTEEFMPADREEIIAARKEGIQFYELLRPLSLDDGLLKCQAMRLTETGSDGRRHVEPVPGKYKDIAVDSVIAAIGEQVETEILLRNGIELTSDGRIRVNPENNETSVPGVFIGGDALRGPATVVEAIADARKAADEICRREGKDKAADSLKKQPGMDETITGAVIIDRQRWQEDLIMRKGLVRLPDSDVSGSEASRCLGCNLLCNKCVDVCPNRANVAVAVEGMNDAFQILHLDSLCNECGNCATFCPLQGAPYQDKPTLYADEESLAAGKAIGICFLKPETNAFPLVKIKIGEEVVSVDLNDIPEQWQHQEPERRSILNSTVAMAQSVAANHAYLIP
jgi:putative selenate reductase